MFLKWLRKGRRKVRARFLSSDFGLENWSPGLFLERRAYPFPSGASRRRDAVRAASPGLAHVRGAKIAEWRRPIGTGYDQEGTCPTLI